MSGAIAHRRQRGILSQKRTNLSKPFDISQIFEAFAGRCSVKKVLLKISKKSQQKHLRWSLFDLQVLAQVFFVNFAKFLKTTFSREHLWWLLLIFETRLL